MHPRDGHRECPSCLRDLAGKFGTCMTAVNTQPCTRPSAASLGDELSHQEGKDDSVDIISLHGASEGSPHTDILSHIQSAAKILGLDSKEATVSAPQQGVLESISHAQPPVSISVAEDYSQMLSKAWTNSKAAPQFNAGCRRFAKIDYAPESGMGNMPSVERKIATLTTLGPDRVTDNPRCPGKQCQKTDRLMCQTYNAATRAARSGNTLVIVMATLRKVISSGDRDALNLVDTALITHSQLTRDIGASMSSAILARRQIWLAQTSLLETIKKE